MSLTRFRYFIKVARLNSIREAADALHIAPSAISRQIDRLEEELGVSLFERSGRGIRLTQAGQILLTHASTILDAFTVAQSQINDLVGLRRGHIEIWSVEGSVANLVLPAISKLQQRHPALTYELTVAGADQVVQALLDDEAEIGIAFNPPELPKIKVVSCMTSGLLAVCHPNHEIAQLDDVTLAQVCSYPLALPNASFGLRHMIDAAAKAARIELNPAFHTNSIEALLSYARVGIGLTVLPYLAISKELRRGEVAAVRLKDRNLREGRTTVLVREDRLLPIAVQELSQELTARIQMLEQAN